MHLHNYQQENTNLTGPQMPTGCFSNSDVVTPEFLTSTNYSFHGHHQLQPCSTNSFDFYSPTFYASNYNNNTMVMPFDDMHPKPEHCMNGQQQQQPFPSDIPFMGVQNYLPTVSYDNMHMMTAPAPTAIPASPLSSVFSSSLSPQMDDFLSMDYASAPLSDIETRASASQPFSSSTANATPQCTKIKGSPVMPSTNDSTGATTSTITVKKRKKQSMVSVLGEFVCEFEGCGKVFGRKYNLSSHLVTHYAERKYFCDHCPKAFVRRHDLKRHMRIHTGETPHNCLYCDRGFGRADALQRHYLTDNACALFYNNDPLRNQYKKKPRSTGFGAKA